MKGFLFLCEGGLILFDENSKISTASRLGEASEFVKLKNGEVTSSLIEILKKASGKGFNLLTLDDEGENLLSRIGNMGWRVEKAPKSTADEIKASKVKVMIEAGLAQSEDEATTMMREAALELSKSILRELSAKPDLQVMESIQALDEIDKIVNILVSRVREWYGLHFPEVNGLVDDGKDYCELILKVGRRENIEEEAVMALGISKARAKALLDSSSSSKGAPVREVDLKVISSLAETALKMHGLRDDLAKHVDSTMNSIAPNLMAVAGSTIGARLIAKSGGLDKLAKLPSSTIQILGAEKALFRALKTGSRPPKHGILFQHQAVHSAPKWLRGKIARSVAGKIAIAARIDSFRGSRETGIEESLKARLEEIRTHSKEPSYERAEVEGRGYAREGRRRGRRLGRERRKKGEKNSREDRRK